MSRSGPIILLLAALGLGMAAGASKKKRKGDHIIMPPEDVGREPEGGNDPLPGGTDQTDGGSPKIVNLLNDSPPEKRKGSRSPWAAVLHQMGFSRGDDPYKYKKVTAHYIITPNGTIAQLHPVTAYLNAANGFNEGGISIEFAGNLPTQPQSDDPKHFWNPEEMGMDQLTPAQVKAARWLLQYLQDEVLPDLGLGLTVVVAHRQSGEERQNDPGPDVWANVGQWAVDNMGLSDGGPGFAVGEGNPIPDKWRNAPLIA